MHHTTQHSARALLNTHATGVGACGNAGDDGGGTI